MDPKQIPSQTDDGIEMAQPPLPQTHEAEQVNIAPKPMPIAGSNEMRCQSCGNNVVPQVTHVNGAGRLIYAA